MMKLLLIFYTSLVLLLTVLVVQPNKVTAPTDQNQITTKLTIETTDLVATSTNIKPLEEKSESKTSTKTPIVEIIKPIEKIEVLAPTPELTENQKQPNYQTQPETIQATKSNDLVRKAVVNIFCTAKNQTLNSVSGSGVIIDPRGIILTNAHIAQFFLLTDYLVGDSISCIIRTDSPAYPRYKAELVYISPSWIIKNSSILTSQNPTGTGEQDYAFLRITEALDNSTLPLFDFLVMENNEPVINQPVILAGYPASFLGSIAIERNLFLLSALSSVFDIFTFRDDNTVDLISVGSSVLAQHGASGGAVASGNGTLLGIIVTTTEATTTAKRDLRAITTTHIERSFKKETGSTLLDLLSGNISETAKNFEKTVAPTLKEILISALQSQ